GGVPVEPDAAVEGQIVRQTDSVVEIRGVVHDTGGRVARVVEDLDGVGPEEEAGVLVETAIPVELLIRIAEQVGTGNVAVAQKADFDFMVDAAQLGQPAQASIPLPPGGIAIAL